MTQDMINKIMTRLIFTQKDCTATLRSLVEERFFLCNKTALRLALDEITARAPRDYGSSLMRLRLVVTLLLMMVVGVNNVWGQVEVTTDDDITNHTEKLYWIESGSATGFFMIPDPDDSNASTTNAPNEKMLWYFMDASEDNTQYYYVVNYETGSYLKLKGNLGDNGSIGVGAYDSGTDDKFKFSIEQNGSVWVFYPKEKKNNTRYSVNKQGGNVSYKKSANELNYLLKASTSTATDVNSQWKLVEYNDVRWAHPFTNSTNDEKHYYYIHNRKTTTLYMNIDVNNYVTVSNADNDNRVWYFEEAESDANIPNLKYYYIVNAETGNYMYYSGAITGESSVANNVKIQAHPGGEEDRYQFAIVNAIGLENNVNYSAYSIMPRLLMDKYDYNHRFNSLGTSSTNNNTKISTRTDRGSNMNDAHWTIEETSFAGAWADPEIDCDENGTITITQSEGAPVHYTSSNSITPPDTPTSSDNPYDGTNKPSAGTGFTTIKARAIGGIKDPSNVVTKTIVYNPTIAFATGDETYSGTAKVPVVKVGDTEINSTEYNTACKKGGVAAEFKDAGDYTIELTDADGGNYIVYGSESLTINKKALTATAVDKEVTYGDPVPTFTANYTGFVNEETEPGFTTQPEFSCGYTSTSDISASPYTITISGGVAPNYEITTYNSGTLTVTPKAVGLTWSTPTSFDYDGNSHIIVATVTDLVGSDEIGVTVTPSAQEGSSLTNGNAVKAGSYTATASVLTGTKAGNYSLPAANTQDFTINKIGLSVTAKPKTITYGDEPANAGVTYSGFVEGESEETEGMFTGTLSYVYSYSQYDDVGDAYTITPDGLTATNYAITFNNGTLTVNQREAVIGWGNTSLGYTGSAQTPTATVTNVVNNDDVSVTVTGAQTDVGTGYTATATGITGAKASNYVFPSSTITTTFSIGPGTFTPTVSIDGWTYGGTSNSPSVSGNTSGGDVTYSYTVKGEDNYSTDVPTNAGEYTVKVTIAAKGNYASVEATTDFTISPKSIGDGIDAVEGIDIKMTQVGENVEVTYVKDGDQTLVVNEDYTVEKQVRGDDNYIIVNGIGNYGGSVQGLFVKSVFTKPTEANQSAAVYQASSDLAKPSDIMPYIVRKVNPSIGTMVITPIGYIPKDVPVLMLRTSETTGFLASPKEESTDEITVQTKNSNMLKVAPEGGVDVEAAQVYTFYNGEFVLTKKGKLSKGKFFLYNPNYTAMPSAEEEQQQGGGNAPSLSVLRFVIEEEATGIDDVRSKMEDVRDSYWYTLDGQRLNGKPTKAGLYIWNGRKTIIKRK